MDQRELELSNSWLGEGSRIKTWHHVLYHKWGQGPGTLFLQEISKIQMTSSSHRDMSSTENHLLSGTVVHTCLPSGNTGCQAETSLDSSWTMSEEFSPLSFTKIILQGHISNYNTKSSLCFHGCHFLRVNLMSRGERELYPPFCSAPPNTPSPQSEMSQSGDLAKPSAL